MAQKKQDLKPDTVLKNYWRNNDRFADFFNAVLFEGRQVIKPEELEDDDTEESSILEHREFTESIQTSRDNIKIQKKSTAYGIELVMLGMESQEHIHYAMPMRVMGYDYSVYKKQYDINADKCKGLKDLNGDEFLSGMRKTDKFTAVITVVVYYGEKPWDGARSLHEMLNIPEEMKKYVNDYRMILVEARENNLMLQNENNVDFFNLLAIILDRSISRSEAKEKAIQYSDRHGTDKSVIMTLAGAANGKIDYNAFEKGDGKMCTLFEEIARENEIKGIKQGIEKGKIEGRAEGIIETGVDFGLSDKEILDKLQIKLNISLQMAQEYFSKYGK
nr:Rpn family recombination-promoting nuclease/putative transposase [uncultured Schaedlerella sp.]